MSKKHIPELSDEFIGSSIARYMIETTRMMGIDDATGSEFTLEGLCAELPFTREQIASGIKWLESQNYVTTRNPEQN